MNAAPAPAAGISGCFGDDEPVFDGYLGQLPGVAVPVFGQRARWSAACIRRPSNRPRKDWKIVFPVGDPVWNLRCREVAFAMLNPAHRALRAAGIYRSETPERIATVRHVVACLRALSLWAAHEGMPQDLDAWEPEDWQAFLEHARGRSEAGASSGRRCIETVRRLHELSGVLTGGGPRRDPWDRRSASKILGVPWDPALRTAPIPPAVWWPLVHDAWTYLHTFAPDILGVRAWLAREHPATAAGARRAGYQVRRPQDAYHQVRAWLDDPAHLVPVHERAQREAKAGEPMWVTLSLLITGGRSCGLFGRSAPGRHALARRALVMAAVAQGRVKPLRRGQGAAALDVARQPGPSRRNGGEVDAAVRAWLSDPSHAIAVRETGEPAWETLEKLTTGRGNIRIFSEQTASGRRRRAMVLAALGQDNRPTQMVTRSAGLLDYRFACPGFAEVRRADGERAPWREGITPRELEIELRMVRAAGYVFIAALSMMRDSEIQEVQRGAVTSHFGSPAVVSRKVKADSAEPELRWWVIEQVAEALEVLGRLSWHPSHVFATLEPPRPETGRRVRTRVEGRRGISAADDIDFFIEHVNANAPRTGLSPIPPGRVRPHMFRRTMAIIAAQQPDGEIALGMQLKHAARRALANRTTQAYYAADASWAGQFDTQYELAAAARLVDALRRRQDGQIVAFGPGAGLFHDRLDRVAARLAADPALRAQIGDQAVLTGLLREQFPDLHWGTLNHCLWNPAAAECQAPLPESERGGKPLLGACQPGKCRNSTITDSHMPVWLAEEEDLRTMLTDLRMAPPRRASLRSRLGEVEQITGAWRRARGELEGEAGSDGGVRGHGDEAARGDGPAARRRPATH